jgi:hypothetical protein
MSFSPSSPLRFHALFDPDGPVPQVNVGHQQRRDLSESQSGTGSDPEEISVVAGRVGDNAELWFCQEPQVGLGLLDLAAFRRRAG